MRIESYESQNELQVSGVTDRFTEERYKQFHKNMPAGSFKVLDVGCSTGRGGSALRKLDSRYEITGLDCVRSRLDALPDAYSEKLLGLSNSIPIEDQTYDAVLAGEFIEHLYPIDVDSSLCEFQRVLKIGGVLLLTTPNPSYLKNKIKGLTVYGVSHLTQHHASILKRRLLGHGFGKVKITGSGKVTRILGDHFPVLSVYGSYLVRAVKW